MCFFFCFFVFFFLSLRSESLGSLCFKQLEIEAMVGPDSIMEEGGKRGRRGRGRSENSARYGGDGT